MNEKTSFFQLALMIVAGAIALGGVFVFAFYRPGSGNEGAAAVVWGTLPAEVVSNTLVRLQGEGEQVGKITYVEKDPATFDRDLVDAIADGGGPDVVLIEAGQIVQHSLRLLPIPYEALPLRDLRDTVATADAWVGARGVYGVPAFLDPIVLYHNTSALASAGAATVPEYWDQVLSLVPRLTVRGDSLSVSESGVGLGEYENVTNAKEVFYALALQAGSPIVSRLTPTDAAAGTPDRFDVFLGARLDAAVPPAAAALQFFTQFADPSKEVYTWNRSLPATRERFLAGDLAMYLGLASDRGRLREANPNLPFDVAVLPQSRSRDGKTTYARSYGFAIVRTAPNPAAAFAAIQALTSEKSEQALAEAVGFAPARRVLLGKAAASRADDAAVYASAIVAQAVLEPSPSGMADVVRRMIESVTSGRSNVDAAIDYADRSARALLPAAAAPAESSGGAAVPALAPQL